MIEKSKGGVRKGSGRKPSPNPKQPVTVFVETSIIESYGGKDALRSFLYDSLMGISQIRFSTPPGVYDAPKLDASKIEDEVRFPVSKKKTKPKTTPVAALKPNEWLVANYEAAHAGLDKEAVLKRIAEYRAELNSPPKNPAFSTKNWAAVLKKKIEELENQLK
jgi:hypothetical protein